LGFHEGNFTGALQMRKSILAVTAALALGLSSSVMASGQFGTVTHSGSDSGGSLIQGSSASAGSISGAITTETGFAGTYGISNMTATSSGKLRSNETLGLVKGTSFVKGHSESGTLVEGEGMAGSIAGGHADAGFSGSADFSEGSHQHFCIYLCGPSYNEELTQSGETFALGGATGSSWAATGSIGDGEGLSVQGFEAYGNAKGKTAIDQDGNEYTLDSIANTSSGAISYTIEEGNAIGQTHSVGWALAGADTWRVHGDADGGDGDGGNPCGGNCGVGGGNGGGNGTGNEGNNP
jgi:hypothetical protein